jgi:Transglutaminase-like superfamily
MGAWRGLRSCVSSPGDAFLLARMAAWAPSLPVLKRTVSLPRLVRLMASGSRQRTRDTEREQRIARMARLLYRGRAGTFQNNCLERSLLTYRYLGRAGADPELVIGARKDDDTLQGHVWVTVDGRAVHELPDELEPFVQVMCFRGGELQGSAGSVAGPLPGPERGAEAQQ